MNKHILLAGVVVAFIVSLVANVRFYSPATQQAQTGPLPVSTSSVAADVTPTKASSSASSKQPVSSSSSADKTQAMGTSGLASGFDLSDDRVLMGISHNVFVGKVVELVSVYKEGALSAPRFAVRVLFNVKGNLEGTVTVNQPIGDIYAAGPEPNLGDRNWLQPGATYLLATRWNPGDVYGIVAGTSLKLITTDSTLSDAQLQTLAMNDYRVIQLELAYPSEILDRADVLHNNTRNSYQSLSAEQKAALPKPPTPPPPPPPPPPPAPTSTASSTGK